MAGTQAGRKAWMVWGCLLLAGIHLWAGAADPRDEKDQLEPVDEETTALLDEGGKLKEIRQYEKALEKCQAALARLDEKKQPRRFAETLDVIAFCHLLVGRPREAEGPGRKAVEILRKVLGADHRETLKASSVLAIILNGLGKLSEAEPIQREVLEGLRRVLGEENEETLATTIALADILLAQGRLSEAEALSRKAFEIDRRVFGEEHILTFATMNSLARILQAEGRLAEAEPLFTRTLEFQRRSAGEENVVALTMAMNNMAVFLYEQGKFREAEALFRKTLDLERRLLGEEHTSTLNTMSNLASLLTDVGMVIESEALLKKAIEGRRRILGEEHPDTLTSMNNLGTLLQEQGKLSEAEPILMRVLEVRRKLLGEAHPYTLISMDNLSSVLKRQGKLPEAEALLREELEVARGAFGEEHPLYLSGMNSLALLLKQEGKPSEAEPIYRRALEVGRRVLGEENPNTTFPMINLAVLLREERKPGEAEGLLRKAMETQRRIFGEESPSLLPVLFNLALVLHDLDRVSEAEGLLSEALSTSESSRARVLGDERDRALYAEALQLPRIAGVVSGLLVTLGRPGDSFDSSERGRSRALLDLLSRSERDLLEELRREGGEAGKRFQAVFGAEEEAIVRLRSAENLLAATKGRRDLEAPRKEALLKEQKEAVQTAEAVRRGAEREVLVHLQEARPEARAERHVSIRAALEPGDVLLGYTWTEDVVLLHILPAEGSGEIEGLLLADGRQEAAELTALAGEYRAWLASPKAALSGAGPSGPGRAGRSLKLAEKVLPPKVLARVKSAKRVVVLPDGPLVGIPLESLVTGMDGGGPRFFMDEGPEVVYAPSGTVYRRLVRTARRAGEGQGSLPTVVVVGDPVYERKPEGKAEAPEKGILLSLVAPGSNAEKAGLRTGDVLESYGGLPLPDPSSLKAVMGKVEEEVKSGKRGEKVEVTYWRKGEVQKGAVEPGKLGVRIHEGPLEEGLTSLAMLSRGVEELGAEASALDQLRLHGGILKRLPGTAAEARGIARIVEGAGGKAEVLLGEEATVEKLSRGVLGKRYVHLATHGIMGTRERPYEASLALTRPGTYTAEDTGFLRLDDLVRGWRGKLRGSELVVLSACESGVGVKAGDSTMALPWGFLYAGAPAVVASLWKVEDRSGALLMTRLYGNLLSEKGRRITKAGALREAKRWLRDLGAEEARKALGIPDGGEWEKVRGELRGIDLAPDEGEAAVRAARPFAHPFYWAAFVLIGDPE